MWNRYSEVRYTPNRHNPQIACPKSPRNNKINYLYYQCCTSVYLSTNKKSLVKKLHAILINFTVTASVSHVLLRKYLFLDISYAFQMPSFLQLTHSIQLTLSLSFNTTLPSLSLRYTNQWESPAFFSQPSQVQHNIFNWLNEQVCSRQCYTEYFDWHQLLIKCGLLTFIIKTEK